MRMKLRDCGSLRLAQGDTQLPQLTLRHRRRRVAHQVCSPRGLGEWDYVADGGFACQDHHQAIETESDSAVRRSAVFQRIQEKAETAVRFLRSEPKRSENLRLHVAAMDTN